ncbi:hypothetical protein E4T81_13435 [Barnesiella sp. WM24]|uniref:fimbrillin family protein n=1 Tax=Barnesiella sp. WM24 TaxID=2558278 RepID=UPI0010729C6B|nr:fimbrillin family protein [Barnesiella sp. WM24]TFU92109.1 hypothetical protein E4T81_13435 [Barnesiella sp. WM24]
MKIHHYGIPLSVAALLLPVTLGSCSDDFDRPEMASPEGLGFEFSVIIEQDNSSRADESGFADGDRFGAYVVNYSGGQPGQLALTGNQVNNVAIGYTADDNQWTPATPIYWLDDKTPADVYAYYPFTNGMSDVEAHRFEVSADQSIAGTDGDMGTYEASDFLWAKASRVAPGTRINLSFSHRLAGVKVVLEQGSGFAEGEWEKLPRTVTVDNTVRTASIDLSTGTATVNGTFDRHVTMNSDATDSYRAVVVPQSVAAGKSTIGITIDGTAYNYTRGEGMTYTAGKLHVFTLRVDNQEQSGDYALSLVSEDITPWETDNSSHDFEANSYLVVDVPTGGTLKECLAKTGADFSTVKNLKVTGTLSDKDFYFMRDEMSVLTAVNLKDVKVRYRGTVYDKETGWHDNVDIVNKLPDEAFLNKTTLHRVILPETIEVIGQACFESLILSSTITIPESVKIIERAAFQLTTGVFSIILPSKLTSIENSAFNYSAAQINLNLPNSLKYIGDLAFAFTINAYGTFQLPSNLEYLGTEAFLCCGKELDGDIEIPEKISFIAAGAFYSMGFKKAPKLRMHDGITCIDDRAFFQLKFSEPIVFPKNLTTIGEQSFSECSFIGEVNLPDCISRIGAGAFNQTNITGTFELPKGIEAVDGKQYMPGTFASTQINNLIIGDNIEIISSYAFRNNNNLSSIAIGKNVSFIGEEAFAYCSSLNTIVCLAKEPPLLEQSAFAGLQTLNCVVEVPEESVGAYRAATGWSSFGNITPHHELSLSITKIDCLNKGISREVVLKAKSEWEIAEIPSWIHVTPERGSMGGGVVKVTVDQLALGSGKREGDIVFRLKESGYTNYMTVRQYDYSYEEDKEIVLQSASRGGCRPVPVFIVGEGYGAESIVNGDFIRRARETMEQLFAIEPYKSYRDMFSVSTAVSLSPDNGITDINTRNETKFSMTFPYFKSEDVSRLENYAKTLCQEIDNNNIGNALIIILANCNVFNGDSYHHVDGCEFAFIGNSNEIYPYDNRGLVQHFAGGAAFGGLAEEGIAHMDFIKSCSCSGCNGLPTYYSEKAAGRYENVTLSGKMDEAPWREFIFHPKYSGIVDMYEGGYKHLRGVWRSEQESVMNSYIPYYNTISRYTIYKEIMRKAGLNASLDEFIANDKIEIPQ